VGGRIRRVMMRRIGIRSIIRGNIIGVCFFSTGTLLYIMGGFMRTLLIDFSVRS